MAKVVRIAGARRRSTLGADIGWVQVDDTGFFPDSCDQSDTSSLGFLDRRFSLDLVRRFGNDGRSQPVGVGLDSIDGDHSRISRI